MNRELGNALRNRHPILLRDLYNARYNWPIGVYGLECGGGWYHLVDELCFAIEAALTMEQLAAFMVYQIKEQRGHLHLDHGSRTRPLVDSYELVDLQIHDAAVRSLETCEICGESGELRKDDWAIVLCDPHHSDRSWEDL